jgi:hypothetical protein
MGGMLATDSTRLQHRAANLVVLAIASIAFVLGLARLAGHAQIAFAFPYAMDYGEGVVWQQMRDVVAGEAYRPIGLDRAVAYQYPPIYHLVVAATASIIGMDELYAGRLISLVCTGLCALLVGWLTAKCVRDEAAHVKLGAATIAALSFTTLPLLATWAVLMRIDMLACFLTLAGMLLASRAPKSLTAAVAAGLVFTAALYTRQTCLPAPAAAFIVLWIVHPRRAWTMAGVSAASGLAALAWLETATRGGFLLNIVSYNVNRIIWDHAAALGATLLADIIPIAIAGIGAVAAWRKARRQGLREIATRQTALAIVLLTLALKTLMLPAILKSGASDNYLIDWFTQISVLVGLASVPLLRSGTGPAAKPSMLLSILFAIGLPIYVWGSPPPPDPAAMAAQRRGLDDIVALIRRSERPVLTDDPTLLIRAGKPMRWETAMIAEMGSFGRYDERGFAQMIRRRDFGFFVTEDDRGDLLFDQRFNPIIADAIHAAYPRHVTMGGRILHLPLSN